MESLAAKLQAQGERLHEFRAERVRAFVTAE
jgi:hypothetical protein